MSRFAFFRRLALSFFLLCLFGPARISGAQNSPGPTPPVPQLVDQARAAYRAGKTEDAQHLFDEALKEARQRKDQAGEALTLTENSDVFAYAYQPQKALELHQQALSLARSAGDKRIEARTISNIGSIYIDMNQPQKALEFYQQALSLRRAIGDKRGEAESLTNIGGAYGIMGQWQKALEFLQQALPTHRALENKVYEALTLTAIGGVHGITGQWQKALDFMQQALSIDRAIGDKHNEANILANMGYSYVMTNQPQKALEVYQQALAIRRAIGDKRNEAEVLKGIGDIYYNDQPQKALEFFQQALPLSRQAGNKGGEAHALYIIGNVYSKTGQPQKGFEFYEQALPLFRQVGNKVGEALALNNIGLLYIDTGQPQRALKFFQQALPLFKQAGNKGGEAVAISNIGAIYSRNGQPQKGLKFLQQAAPLFRQTGDKSLEADVFNDIGRAYSITGQPQKALKFFRQALLLFKQAGTRYGEALTLNNIGLFYTETGQPQKALKLLQQALPLFRQTGDKSGEAVALNTIASCEQNLSQPQQAMLHVQQAVNVLEELRANVGSQGDARSTFLASKLYVYYHCLNLLRQNGKVEEAFALTQKTKARSLLDLLASSRVDLTAALTPAEKQQFQTLQAQAQQLNQRLLKEGVENEVGAKKRFAALQAQLKQTESELQTLTDRLYALHPQMAEQQQARTATGSDIARLLPDDAVLLEYVQTSGKELLLFVVSKQAGNTQVHLHSIVINSVQLQKQCAAFHAACADPRKDSSALSASLSRLLLSPAHQELAGKTRLIVCPDGALWDVSFAALQSPGRPKRSAYLWQQYDLSYAYSATGMQAAANARARHKPAEHASVLALANPFFGDSSRFGDLDDVSGQRPFELPSRPFELPSRPFELPSRPLELPSRPVELPSRQLTAALQNERGKAIKSLPGAQQEADAIHRLFPDAAIYTGKQAQEHVVTEEAGKYKYLHFATHGFFNDAAPLLSCIVLAQPEQPLRNKAQDTSENNSVTVANIATKPKESQIEPNVEDGLLTARKVFGLHLNADLVTLSACNSGRGQIRTGEGIVGLTWAFFAAGCPSQVVSQWSVDDAATGQLMSDFYKGLKQGKSKSAALRNAALKLSKDGKHSHPYYWTPFFLMGDWK